jgi:hypothetical protein
MSVQRKNSKDGLRKSSAGARSHEALSGGMPLSGPKFWFTSASDILLVITVGVAHDLRGDVEAGCILQLSASRDCKESGAGLVMNSYPLRHVFALHGEAGIVGLDSRCVEEGGSPSRQL